MQRFDAVGGDRHALFGHAAFERLQPGAVPLLFHQELAAFGFGVFVYGECADVIGVKAGGEFIKIVAARGGTVVEGLVHLRGEAEDSHQLGEACLAFLRLAVDLDNALVAGGGAVAAGGDRYFVAFDGEMRE